MMRKVRSSKSGSSGGNKAKGVPQPEWEEGASSGDNNSPRSDVVDCDKPPGNKKVVDSEKSTTGLQSKNFKLAKELVRIKKQISSLGVCCCTYR